MSEGAHVVSVDELLRAAVAAGASDLHLTIGVPPMVRLVGDLKPLPGYPVLSPEDTEKALLLIMNEEQRDRFREKGEVDFSYGIRSVGRFRVNVFRQRGSVGAAFRVIPYEIRDYAALGLPQVLTQIARRPRGLVLVTGPTGSGKSTTLAAIVDQINHERRCHIVTLEDPIEYLHHHVNCIVNQREIGTDTLSFAAALRSALREDPDVILVGEMRDLETIATALTAAETGHLVLATLHTGDAVQTVDRIIDVFPPHQQQQVRVQLASSLVAIVAQQLLPTVDGRGRVVACEVMVATPAIRNLIRESKTHQIYSLIQTGARYGMQTMDAALKDLCSRGVVSWEEALARCHDQEEFKRLAQLPASFGGADGVLQLRESGSGGVVEVRRR